MRADAREKRAALVDAARRLFAERGPMVPLRSVATEAGVGIATLYRHFPTREDLLIGVMEDMADRILAIIDRHSGGWGTPEEADRTWHTLAHEIAALKIGALAQQAVAIVPMDGVVWRETERFREQLIAAYDGVLTQAAAYGLVAVDLPPWRFQLGLGAISRPLPEQVETLAPGQQEWLVDNFLQGLRPR